MACRVISTQALEFFLFLCCCLGNELGRNVTCPAVCFCDETGLFVSCFGDEIWPVPDNLPETAQRLELMDFVLASPQPSLFQALLEVRELRIQNSRLAMLEGEIFVHMVKLNRLYLGQNEIQNLTEDVFEGLQDLRVLDLSDNRLTNVRGAFTKLCKVEQLNLRANRISHLDSKVLKGLHNLQYLNLDSNSIVGIDTDAFEFVTSLVHFTVSNNPIGTLSRLNFFSNRLHNVDLTNTGLQSVPQSLSRFVKDLRMGQNNISRLATGDFDSYPYLELLVLDDNGVADLERDCLGRQDYLLRLWLNRNGLRHVPEDLPPNLKSLHMEQNKLQTLPSYTFKGLFKLEQLFLQKSDIRNLSMCSFCDLHNLVYLDLKGNQIGHLFEGVFNDLFKVLTLDLSENKLNQLDARCFVGLVKLNSLHMSGISNPMKVDNDVFENLTGITTLEMFESVPLVQSIMSSSTVLRSLSGLKEINMMHCKIRELRPDVQTLFPHLKLIKLSGNEWNCTSKILWLAEWIRSSRNQFFRAESLKCITPPRLTSRTVLSLTEVDYPQELSLSLLEQVETTHFQTPRTTTTTTTTSTTSTKTTTTTTSATIVTTATVISPSTSTTTERASVTVFQERTKPSKPETGNTILPALAGKQKKAIVADVVPSPGGSHHGIGRSWTRTAGGRSSEDTRTPSRPHRLHSVTQPQRRTEEHQPDGWSRLTAVTVSTSLAGGSLIILASLVVLYSVCRFRARTMGQRRQRDFSASRRRTSVSFYPQQDEVAILTVSENTVG